MGIAPDAIKYLWDRLEQLEPDSELGGICAFKPGYHASRKENKANWPNDYSIQDPEDQGGDDDWCAAIDWTFPEAQSGHYATINKYSKRLMASGEDVNDARLNNLREFFGNTDSDVKTEGWDFRAAVKTTSADNSHAWHIHISFDRKWANDRPTMDRLISVLQGDDEMTAQEIAHGAWRTDGEIENKYLYWREDSAAHVPPPAKPNDYITGQTAIVEAATQARKAFELGQDNAAKIDQILAILQSGVPVPGEVNLTPAAIQNVADAVSSEVAERLVE